MTTFNLTCAAVEQHSLEMRQFIDFRAATLPGGMRVIDAYNSSGLTFTLLPERGLDLWLAAYNGRPLTWISQGAPHAPDFGASWLRLFNGGVLVTCGLRHAGPPETDERNGELRDLHGDYTRLRAGTLAARGVWQGDRYVMELTGVVTESTFFGDQLRLTRTLRMALGEPAVEIVDVVKNLNDTPTPFMLLYHFNFGYPLVQEGVQLYSASAQVYPRDLPARAQSAHWNKYGAPVARHQEEVFFHQVYTGDDGVALAALAGDDFGLQIEWDTQCEPYLTQWKNYRRGMYVCGVEPGNCIPEGQNAARRSGRLVTLAPGEQHAFRNKLTVLPDANAVAAMKARVDTLLRTGVPVNISLGDYAAQA